MTLQEFHDACASHDWYYEMSDDHRVWQRGQGERMALLHGSGESTQHDEIYKRWRLHAFSGPNWGTEKAPKPERPQK
jgi:hypothetical protein